MSLENGGVYKIVNAKSGTVLDLSGSDNHSVIGWNDHGGQNQQWRAHRVADGWHFENIAKPGQFLGLSEVARDGARVVASGNRQTWHVWHDEADGSVYRICIPETMHNLDLSGYGNASNGTPIETWGRWEGKHQCWRFERV